MTVSEKTIQTEGLGEFFEDSGKTSAEAGKKLAKNVKKSWRSFRNRIKKVEKLQ